MKLSMILARSMDNVIGINNALPWKCPADLANFKKITSGPNKAVVMGRNTWDSLPKKPLPGRFNIIVTGNPDKLSANGIIGSTQLAVSPSIQDAIYYAKSIGIEELIFIGGKGIYEEAVNIVDEIYLTEMNWNTLSDNDTGKDDVKVYFDSIYATESRWDILARYTHREYDGKKVEDIFEFFHLKRK